MSVAFPVLTVEGRLRRAQSLAAMLESFVPVMADGASNHDFLIDSDVYDGLAMVANVIREDIDSAMAVIAADEGNRLAPWDLRGEADRAEERRRAGAR